MAAYLDESVKNLIERGTKAYSSRASLLSYWQESAEYFHPSRADFTATRYEGREFLENLTTSTSVLMASQLADIFTTTTRPSGQKWFNIGVDDPGRLSHDGWRFLEWCTDRLRFQMLNPHTGFTRATKEADYDLVAFGNSVKSLEWTHDLTGLTFNNWHLRDVVWFEAYNRKINEVHRKWSPTAIQLKNKFPKTVHPKIVELCGKDPHKAVECRHIVVPSDAYMNKTGRTAKKGFPFMSLHVDVENMCLLEEVPQSVLGYVIPRWATSSNSVYGYSPPVMKALPDVRLLNEITLTLLEAGQKAVDPPMMAIEEAIRSDINLMARGITYVSVEGLEGNRPIMQPLSVDKTGLAFGVNLSDATKMQIFESFYLNKLNLPTTNGGMSPFEVSQRIQEFVRNAYPLFQPIEIEDNNEMCQMAFSMLMNRGFFGSPDMFPKGLQGQNVKFTFENPLVSARDEQAKQAFMEGGSIIAQAAAIDPTVVHLMDTRKAARDVMHNVGFKSEWMKSDEEIDAIVEQEAQARQLAQGAAIAEQVGNAGAALQKGMGQNV